MNIDEIDALCAIRDAARVCVVAYGQECMPSGDLAPEIEHLEVYIDTCWNTVKPMIALRATLKDYDELVGDDQ